MARKSTNAERNGMAEVADSATSAATEDAAAQIIAGANPKKAAKKKDESFVIPKMNLKVATFKIVGRTSLIVHAWSEKAIRIMLDKQEGKAEANAPHEPKDSEADYNGSRYISEDGWDGFPAVAIKAALVNSCRLVRNLAMTVAKRAVFVYGDGLHTCGMDLVKIQGTEPKKRRDMVRLPNGDCDIRFRAEYRAWWAMAKIEFNAGVFSLEQITSLLELAGHGEGLCEWRPGAPKSNTGNHGRFGVSMDSVEVRDV